MAYDALDFEGQENVLNVKLFTDMNVKIKDQNQSVPYKHLKDEADKVARSANVDKLHSTQAPSAASAQLRN